MYYLIKETDPTIVMFCMLSILQLKRPKVVIAHKYQRLYYNCVIFGL